VKTLAAAHDILAQTIFNIFDKDLSLVKKSARWVPKMQVAEPDPAGAETFSRSRSWSRYTEVSAPAPGSGSRAN
jgi:hypothetical protein